MGNPPNEWICPRYRAVAQFSQRLRQLLPAKAADAEAALAAAVRRFRQEPPEPSTAGPEPALVGPAGGGGVALHVRGRWAPTR